nr:hypothetical protein GCM10017611_22910 [Rhodococcus wratislaviensis]
MHPDIVLGRATFRAVDDEPEPEETPKLRARRELKERMTAEPLSRQKTGGTNPEKGEPEACTPVHPRGRRLQPTLAHALDSLLCSSVPGTPIRVSGTCHHPW